MPAQAGDTFDASHPEEVEVPSEIRRGAASGMAAARPFHSTRRPTTVDLIVEAVVAVGGVTRFVVRHRVLVMLLILAAAVVENSYLHR